MRLKKSAPYVATVLVMVLVGGVAAWRWVVEERATENRSVLLEKKRENEAELAESMEPLVDRLEHLREALPGLEPGTAEYEELSEELVEIQNLIAAQMPALVNYHDPRGNAVIVNVDMARRHLEAIEMRLYQDG